MLIPVSSAFTSTVEESQRAGQGQERSGESGGQHRQRSCYPHQTGESTAAASALTSGEITHLTSIRAGSLRGSETGSLGAGEAGEGPLIASKLPRRLFEDEEDEGEGRDSPKTLATKVPEHLKWLLICRQTSGAGEEGAGLQKSRSGN